MARFRWPENLEEIRAMLADGRTGADIARHFGLSRDTTYNGLKRYGLIIDRAATLEAQRRGAAWTKAPHVREQRRRVQQALMADPARRERCRQAMLARMQEDPDMHRRLIGKSMTAAALAARKKGCKRRWDARLSWCPPPFRAEYDRLIRKKGLRAAEAKAALAVDIARWLGSFEGQLWRVATGQARLVGKVRIERPVTYTPSAIAGAMT